MRRSVALIAVLVVVALGCGSESGDQSNRITVMVAGDPEEIEAYRAVVDAFDGSQDEIDAELLPFAERDELIARLSTSIAGGQPPDLFLMNYRYYGQFAARGALEPLEPYLRDSVVFSSEDFFDTAMTLSSGSANRYAYPRTSRAWSSTTTPISSRPVRSRCPGTAGLGRTW